jgi:Flp pilus assembly pilin Flp
MDTSGKTGPRRVAQAGQGLVEYALILCLVAAVAVVGTIFLGKQVSTVLSHTGSALGARSGGDPGSFKNEPECKKAGFQWQDGEDGAPDFCRSSVPTYYTSEPTCDAADYHWWTLGSTTGICQQDRQGDASWHNDDPTGCAAHYYYYWSNGDCEATSQGVPGDYVGSAHDCDNSAYYYYNNTCNAGAFPATPASQLDTACTYTSHSSTHNGTWHWDTTKNSHVWTGVWDCR